MAIKVGGTTVIDDSRNLNNIGIITATTINATSFVGDGSGLIGAGSTVSNDTTTNATYYPLFTQTTSGTVTASGVSTSKLSFNPSTGTLSATNVNDVSGNVRNIPQNSQSSAYTLVAADAGKHVSIATGGVTVPASVFSTGQAITIYNNSGNNQTITQGGSVTLRQAGTANTGNRTLAQYGVATILCIADGATPTFVISGSGLT